MRLHLVFLAALVPLLAALPARAQCNYSTTDFVPNGAGDVTLPTNRILCAGTYTATGTISLAAGSRMLVGAGQKVTLKASTIRIRGVLDANGAGYAGGPGCASGGTGGGTSGTGPGAGGGAGPSLAGNNNANGGPGGGGAGHGGAGGTGGAGSNAGLPGAPGAVAGSNAGLTDLDFGSGGGGAGCTIAPTFTSTVNVVGGNGGAGGGLIVLDAKQVLVSLGGRLVADGVAGGQGVSNYTIPFLGAGGGGGSGGVIVVLASENLDLRRANNSNNDPVTVAGGAGASSRGSLAGAGSGAGGGGGRIKLQRPLPPGTNACPAIDNTTSGGNRGTANRDSWRGTSGAAGSYTCQNNQLPPVITSLTPSVTTLDEGQGLTLTAAATDGNGHLLKYEFDCDGNGSFEVPAQLSPTVTCAYPESRFPGPSVYRPNVRVTDWNSIVVTLGADLGPWPAGDSAIGTLAFGGSVTASDAQRPSITVNNVPPALTLTPAAGTVVEGQSVAFTLTVADTPLDLAGRYSVSWDWGDGSAPGVATNVAPPASQSHAFADEGTYTVSVTVTDREGGQSKTSQAITIGAVAPTVTFTQFPASVVGNGVATGTFGASATDAPADQAAGFTYTFTFTPPTGAPVVATVPRAAGNAAGVTVQQAFAVAGTWTVSVVATDRTGVASAATTRSLTVVDPNNLGVPVITPTQTSSFGIDEGGNAQLGATINDPNPGNNTQPFSWSINWGDGVTTTGTTSGPAFTTIPATTHPYPDSRATPFTITISVQNATGQSAQVSLNLTVRNVAPTVAPGADQTGFEGQALTFTATASDLSQGDRTRPFSYTWNWGDNTADTVTSAGLNATQAHTYADSGTYTVTLTATDADGGRSNPVTAKAIVQNVAPTVTIDGPASGAEGATFTYTAAATDVSPADRTAGFSYEWDWGDGSAKETGATFTSRTHAYRDNGTFTVTVKATDKDGGVGTATKGVTITNVAPRVTIGGDRQVARGEAVTFSPVVTDPGAGDTFTYAWDFGDTTTSTDRGPTKSWSAIRTYTVKLTVTDKDGGTGTDTIAVVVVNRAPVATGVAINPAQPKSNSDLTVAYTFTDADADPESGTSITWFADGQAVPALSNQRTVPGSTTVRGQVWAVEVTPNDGTTAGAPVRSADVTIGNDAPVASQVTLTPASPAHLDTLTLAWTYTDPDGDAQDGTQVRWTKNAQPQPALDDKTTVPAPLVKGDVWAATVTPRDGARLGEPVASPSVTVANSAPVISRLEDVATAATGAQTPVSWTIGATDPDNDALTFRCTRDGAEVGTGANQTAQFTVGTWTIVCTVSDGTATDQRSFTVAVGDVPPVVSAGEDATVDPGRHTLTAVGRDTLGRALSYEWTVGATAEPVTLSDPRAASTTFLAKKAGTYTFTVTVSNGEKQATDTVVVTVRNVAPFAVISPDFFPNARQLEPTVLDGALSGDPNGDPVTWRWEYVSGSGGTFEGGTTGETARFIPQSAGETVLRLTVSDGALTHSATATLRIAPSNPGGHPPVAKAGTDLTVLFGESVTLDGSASFDPDGAQGLSFAWTQKRGTNVTLAGATGTVATFTAPGVAGDLVFTLTADDGTFTATDDVTVHVLDGGGNERPVARITAPETALVNDTVSLDGSTSSDPDSDPLTWRWSWVGGPRVSIDGADAAKASFTALDEGVVELELVVNDGRVDSLPARVSIAVTKGDNKRPTAVARAPESAAIRSLVTLDGSGSSDPEGTTLTYTWQQTGGPNVSLSGADGAKPTFTPVDAGTYTFRLVVSDGIFSSEPAEVRIQVAANLPPTAVPKGPDGRYLYAGDPLTLDGSASTDPEGQPLAKYEWKLVKGSGTLTNADSATPTFVPDQNDEYEFTLVVTDDLGQTSKPETLDLHVATLPVVEGGCLGSQAGPLGVAGLLGLVALLRRRREGSR